MVINIYEFKFCLFFIIICFIQTIKGLEKIQKGNLVQ